MPLPCRLGTLPTPSAPISPQPRGPPSRCSSLLMPWLEGRLDHAPALMLHRPTLRPPPGLMAFRGPVQAGAALATPYKQEMGGQHESQCELGTGVPAIAAPRASTQRRDKAGEAVSSPGPQPGLHAGQMRTKASTRDSGAVRTCSQPSAHFQDRGINSIRGSTRASEGPPKPAQCWAWLGKAAPGRGSAEPRQR